MHVYIWSNIKKNEKWFLEKRINTHLQLFVDNEVGNEKFSIKIIERFRFLFELYTFIICFQLHFIQ